MGEGFFACYFHRFCTFPGIMGTTANASAIPLKTRAYFLSKYLLKSIGGGGIRIENGAEFSSKQPPSNKKNKEREGKS